MYLVAGVWLGYSIGRERLVRKPNTVVVDTCLPAGRL